MHAPERVVVGALSDAHGDAGRAKVAIERLQAAGATVFLYAGDACDLRVIDQFAGLPAWVVAGNCDRHLIGSLPGYCATLGIHYGQVSVELELAGKRILLAHGDPRTLGPIREAQEGGIDYVIRGHEHRREDWRAGPRPTRHLNPGSVAESRDDDGICRALLLDVASGGATWLAVP